MFRNQYLLTNKRIPKQNNINQINIHKFILYYGKDIECHTVKKEKIQITVLGYFFHCYNNLSEQELIRKLTTLDEEALLDEVDCWCGHFILIVAKKNIKIYNDACASFKVFYGKEDDRKIIGSDPKIIREFFDFKEDNSHEKLVFYKSKFFNKNRTKIGHDTRFKNLYQLVSNHCLNVEENTTERIFPRKKREEVLKKSAGKKLISIFKHLTLLIEKRYTVYASLTAGYDSRLVMAATKEVSKKVEYYTFKIAKQDESYIDYTLPKKITSDLNLNYSFIHIKELPENIKETILSSYDLPLLREFEQYRNIFPKNKKQNILLVGYVNEVAKNYLESVNVRNGKDIVRAIHFPDNKYLERYYQKWFNKNQKVITDFNYEILDFIHWEQDITNFAGQNIYYANHYVRLFSIVNSREILRIMLSTAKEERDGKSPKLFEYLIKNMWKELLIYPFNPTLKEKGILLMKRIKVYPFYKYLQLRFQNYGKV